MNITYNIKSAGKKGWWNLCFMSPIAVTNLHTKVIYPVYRRYRVSSKIVEEMYIWKLNWSKTTNDF
jgi:hypothetical protein